MMETEIIKAGLLGIERYTLPLLEPIREIQEKITGQNTSNEDRFLKTTAAALFFQEAGKKPTIINYSIPVCADETCEYIGTQLASLINSLISHKEEALLRYLIFICNKHHKIIPAEFVPDLLNKALAQKGFRQELLQCCGETGKWLCSLRQEWKVLSLQSVEEDVWETGSPENRKAYLSALRKQDPARARQLLENTLREENAATRVSLLETLGDHLSIADEPLLSALLNDKSQKVKDTVLGYLRRLPGSSINNLYLEFLLKSLEIKEERHLLISRKQTLLIHEKEIPEEQFFKSGIERLSPDKKVKDYIYVIGQLLSNINPAQLAGSLSVTEEGLIKLWMAHPEKTALLPFLVSAAVYFKNKAWSKELLLHDTASSIHLLDPFAEAEREPYYHQFTQTATVALVDYLTDENYTLIPAKPAEEILTQLSLNPYQIDASKYQRLALHLPDSARTSLRKSADQTIEDYKTNYYSNQATEMLRLMDLKKIIQ